jgi:hypothetical protein
MRNINQEFRSGIKNLKSALIFHNNNNNKENANIVVDATVRDQLMSLTDGLGL